MSYSEEVKQLAYSMDRECWVSYSGATPDFKRAMDTRRNLSLEAAKRYVDKQKTPTRVKVGYCNKHYVSVPEQITGKGTARLVLDFGSNKDAAEFYEVFKNLIGEKEAQG